MGCESRTRELAQRLSGGDEILLLWNPRDGHLEVAPGSALDAFHHPYAYAPLLGGHDD